MRGPWAVHCDPRASLCICAQNGARGASGHSESETALPRQGLVAGINSEIEVLVKDCPACFVSGKMGNPHPPSTPHPSLAASAAGICGEIHGVPHNQRYLVVVYDLHSKWPELTTTGLVTSQIIVDILDSLFAYWGLPQTITTDNDPQFVSADFSSYLRSKGIQHIHTTLYHPQANGGVEHFHQTLKNGLGSRVHFKSSDFATLSGLTA